MSVKEGTRTVGQKQGSLHVSHMGELEKWGSPRLTDPRRYHNSKVPNSNFKSTGFSANFHSCFGLKFHCYAYFPSFWDVNVLCIAC